MKTILLTGYSGFFGRILNENLKDTFQLSTLGRSSESDIICDLSQSVPKIERPFDLVVHAAGKAHFIPKNEKDIKEFYNVNFEGTMNLCNALLDKLPKSFIYISSISVYGLEEGELITESALLNASSPYGRSKVLTENWLLNWANENKVKLGILRLPLIAGPHPVGNLAALISAIKKGRYLSVGKADARKSIVWAEDVVKIIPKLAETGGIYNLTDGYNPSFRELEYAIAATLGKKKPLNIPRAVAEVIALIGDLFGEKSPINRAKLKKITTSLTFDDSKARRILGWQSTPVIKKIPYML